MDKLTMAHEYFMKHVNTDQYRHLDDEDLISWSFDYVDAMQAETDKREDRTRPEVLEEWQPDWSQAPKNMNYFFMNKDGSKYWTVNKPDKPNLSEHVMDCLDCGGDCYSYASSQDYQGNWQDSLRKRPK